MDSKTPYTILGQTTLAKALTIDPSIGLIVVPPETCSIIKKKTKEMIQLLGPGLQFFVFKPNQEEQESFLKLINEKDDIIKKNQEEKESFLKLINEKDNRIKELITEKEKMIDSFYFSNKLEESILSSNNSYALYECSSISTSNLPMLFETSQPEGEKKEEEEMKKNENEKNEEEKKKEEVIGAPPAK